MPIDTVTGKVKIWNELTQSWDDDSTAPVQPMEKCWPIGSVFMAVVATNPATLLGFGTWQQIAGGRVLVGQTGADTDFDVAEETGGEKTHALVLSEIPAHNHGVTDPGHTHAGRAVSTGTAGTAGHQGAASSNNANTTTSATQSATTGLTTQNAGSGGAHNNMPPYLVVYIWKRTA